MGRRGIQASVGITQLPKAFYVFAAKLTIGDYEDWFNIVGIEDANNDIFNVENYPTYTINIDFNNPTDSVEKLTELTDAIDTECPVAKARGITGPGEGIVWKAYHDNKLLLFKTKGEKHRISKTKETVAINPDKVNSVAEFVEYAVTDNRFNQAIEKVFGNVRVDIKLIGEVLKWVNQD